MILKGSLPLANMFVKTHEQMTFLPFCGCPNKTYRLTLKTYLSEYIWIDFFQEIITHLGNSCDMMIPSIRDSKLTQDLPHPPSNLMPSQRPEKEVQQPGILLPRLD